MDLDQLKKLLELMNQNQLTELEFEEEGFKVRLRKGGADAPQGVAIVHAMPPGTTGAMSGTSLALPPMAALVDADLVEVKAPLVGTYYRSPKPELPPFVEVGTQVKPETTLCIVEAMKVMNEIKAEMEGEVREVLVQNGEAVEFGQPLFRVKKAR